MSIYSELMGWPLNRQQQQAAATRDCIMIIGGPHSGKTHGLVERTAFLLADSSPSGRIACLAVRAGGEAHLQRELRAHPRVRPHLDRVFVGTVDGCAEAYLRSHGRAALDLSADFSVWDEDDAVKVLALVLRNFEPKLTRSVIRDALHHHWENRRRSPHAVTTRPARKRVWLDIAEAYAAAQLQHHALDRYDLPRQAFQALEESARTPALAPSLDRARFRHVVVDQAEELNGAQAEFVRRMIAPGGWLSLAGDPSQAINPESSPGILEYLSYARPVTCDLGGAYNTSRTLLQVARTFRRAHDLPAPGDDRDSPAGAGELAPELVFVDGTLSDLDLHVLEEAQRLHGAGVPWREMAILDPRGRAPGRMKTALLLLGIPHRELGKTPPAGPTDARFIAAVLSLALNPFDPAALRIAGAPGHPNRRRALSDATAHLIMREAYRSQASLTGAFEGLLKAGRLPEQDVGPLECLLECLGLVDRYLSNDVQTLIDLLVGIRDLSKKLKGHLARAAEDSATERLLDLAEAMGPPEDGDRRGRLRRLVNGGRNPDLSSSAAGDGGDDNTDDGRDRRGVALGAISDAKGLRRKVVFFLDVSDEAIPGKVGPHSSRIRSQSMMFHVAITRATERLYLYCLSDTGMSGHSNPSRFLTPIAGLLRQRRVPFREADPFAGGRFRHLQLGRRDPRPWSGPPVPTLRGSRRRKASESDGQA